MPSISVIMPVLNREKYLSAAIDSITAQTFADWELVLSDGGSRDASPDIMRRYAGSDSRIRFFSHPGTNAPEGRNAALAEARGEYVAVLDSDDVALPRRLATQMDYLERHPECAGAGGNFSFIDQDGLPSEPGRMKTRLTDPDALRQRTREGWYCFLHSTMLFRRAALTEIGGYRTVFRYAEDEDLYQRLLDRHSLINLPDVMVQYRWHGENACIPSLPTQIHRVIALASGHCRINAIPDPVDERRQPFDYSYMLELLAHLGNFGMAARLFWIGLLQCYGLGDTDMLMEAWRRTLALPVAMENEIRRHWTDCQDKYPAVAAEILPVLRQRKIFSDSTI